MGSLAHALKMVKEAGFHSAKQQRTFEVYQHIEDWHYMGLHDWIKQKKCGYGKVLDHVCREIRHKRITRSQGNELVKYFQVQKPLYNNLLLDWLGLDMDSLKFIIESIDFDKSINSCDEKINRLSVDMKSVGFIINDKIQRENIYEHIIFGKGYPD